jgi:hypothetical protein
MFYVLHRAIDVGVFPFFTALMHLSENGHHFAIPEWGIWCRGSYPSSASRIRFCGNHVDFDHNHRRCSSDDSNELLDQQHTCAHGCQKVHDECIRQTIQPWRQSIRAWRFYC